jgi:hypothetical protein
MIASGVDDRGYHLRPSTPLANASHPGRGFSCTLAEISPEVIAILLVMIYYVLLLNSFMPGKQLVSGR